MNKVYTVANTISNLQEDASINMQKCIYSFQNNINKIHIGRMSPDILNNIVVEYYGVLTPLSELTNAVLEDPKTLVITVFDLNMIKTIEKAIFTSNLGLVPISHGNVLRVKLPLLTEDRRRILIKMVRSEAEKSKISVRNIRRISNEKVKIFLKNKEINADVEHHFQNEIQKLTDFWIKKVNSILKEKELELMKF